MTSRRSEWYHSPPILFLIAAGCVAPTALFARVHNWFGIGTELSRIFVILAADYAVNAGGYFYLGRGKYGAFLLATLNQLYFWLSLAPIALLLYYGYLTRAVVRANYANYPALRGRLSGVIQAAQALVIVGGVIFLVNIAQAVARQRRARI
jgi:hypothetical protein